MILSQNNKNVQHFVRTVEHFSKYFAHFGWYQVFQPQKLKYIFLTLISSFLISTSLFLDKVILKSTSNFSLQFYYTLTLIIFLLIYLIIKSEALNFSYAKKSYSVINLGIITFIADYIHFVAASHPNSSVVVMTLTRHSSLIITVFLGSLIYKEKNLLLKFIAVLIIIAGLVLTVI